MATARGSVWVLVAIAALATPRDAAAERADGPAATAAIGRPLTRGERGLLAPLFRATVDYDAIRIVRGRAFALQGESWVTLGTIIYAPPGLYRDDYADAGPAWQASLVHEVVHVWQHARGMNVVAEAVRTLIATGGDYLAAYRYQLDDARDLLDYGMEQQASIIADYYQAEAAARGAFRAVLGRFLADPRYRR